MEKTLKNNADTQNIDTDFICLDCGFDTLRGLEYYMLHFELWLEVNNGKSKGMLCIGCVEDRLQRCLVASDFLEAPINDAFLFPMKSQRLLDRLTSS